MTVLISHTPNLDDRNFVCIQEYRPHFLACWRIWESLPSIF